MILAYMIRTYTPSYIHIHTHYPVFHTFHPNIARQCHADCTRLSPCSGTRFKYRKTGMAVPRQICNDNSYGVTVDSNVYEPHVTASTMAHVLGHVIGMAHDDRE